MKKILLYSLLFFLVQIGYGQITLTIELTVDGQSLGTNEDAFKPEDLKWTVTDLNTGCSLDQDEAYRKFVIVMGGVELGGLTILMIDMSVFGECAFATKGHELVFDMEVVNISSKFYGYVAKKTIIVPAVSTVDVLRGEDAINFIAPVDKID